MPPFAPSFPPTSPRRTTQYIAPALLGRDPTKQLELDSLMVQALDQTANLSHLGANAILAVSLAVCKAGAAERGVPLYRHLARLAGNSRVVLPVPSFNILSGGVFSEDCNALPVQEFMIMPTGAKSFSEAMRMGTEVYHHIKVLLAVSAVCMCVCVLRTCRTRILGLTAFS